jgi:protein involved in sex pheromone biosynthesis
MNRVLGIIVICSAFLLTGCDEEAQQYAKELKQVLGSYQEQVERKNNAEQAAYRSLTSYYAHAQEEDLFFKLQLERNERVRKLADEYVKGQRSAPTNTELRALLKDFGNFDFEETRKGLEDESDVNTRYLANLESLQLETEKMESLSKALDSLSKPKRPLTQLKEFVAFATQVDKEFQKLGCEDVAREINCLEKQKAKEKDTAKKELIQAEIDKRQSRLTQLKASGSCPANVDSLTCPG